jgi:branched-chain amino acid transport system ATP-binding protein
MSALLLETAGLCAFYGATQVLFGLDLKVTEGGVTALLGANGAGKTTTLRAVSGMVHTTGEIRFRGQSLVGRATEDIARLGIAHVPQGRGTFVSQTVEENLQIGAMSRRDRAGIAADIERAYGYFPRLKERRKQQAGMLMLLDEPSFGLAPLIVRELFAILRTLNRAENVGMLLVEQNASLALDLADRAYLIETGQLVMTGAAHDLRTDENVRRAYLGY